MDTVNKKLQAVKEAIRASYAWPGGYELVGICSDGGILCNHCMKENYREICEAITRNDNSGWRVDAICYEAVSPDCTPDDYKSFCDHCEKELGELS